MLKDNCFSEHIMQVVKKTFFKMGILYVVNFKRSKEANNGTTKSSCISSSSPYNLDSNL